MTLFARGVWVIVAAAVLVACGAGAPGQAGGQLVFVGTYTTAKSQGIYAYRFNDQAGILSPVGLAIETASPSFIIPSADGRFLFAVNELQTYNGEASGSVSSFAVDRSTGKLTWLSTQSSKGTDPCHLAIDRTGRFLVVANYSSGTLSVLPIGTDGKLAPAVQVIEHRGPTAKAADGGRGHAHQAVFSQDNRYLTAVDLGLDRVLVYRFDAATGRLTPNTPAGVDVTKGYGPRHIAFHADGSRAFLINELGSMVTPMSWDAATGTLTGGPSVSTLPADFKGHSTTAEIEIHPNGKFLYGSNRGHDSIAVFAIGAGRVLTPVEFESTRGKTPRHFTITPGGHWLVAANQGSDTLAVFRIDQTTGALSPAGALTDASTPVCVVFWPR